MSRYDFVERKLEEIKEQKRFRSFKDLKVLSRNKVLLKGEEKLNFSSNDYLGLAHNGQALECHLAPLSAELVGSASSPLVCGYTSLTAQLEEELAVWKGTEEALLINSGFQANSTLIPTLVDRHDVVFSDRLNHASIIDGIKLSGARQLRYKHNDMADLERLLESKRGQYKKALITSESIFSMDGDCTDIAKLCEFAERYDCLLYLDDAHGSGIVGEKGGGPAKDYMDKIDIYLGTFSKAMGSFGAYVACSKMFKNYFVNTCRGLIYSTALPPQVVANNLAVVRFLQSEEAEKRRAKLAENTAYLRDSLQEMNYQLIAGDSPIIPVVIGSEEQTLALSDFLLYEGLLAVAIRPPTVPADSCRIRLTVNASHSKEELDFLLSKLKEFKHACR